MKNIIESNRKRHLTPWLQDLGAAVATLLVASSSFAFSQTELPEGLTAAEWESLCASVEADRHKVFESEQGFAAQNPGQDWTTTFDGWGFETRPGDGQWSWGLELQSWGRGEILASVDTDPVMHREGERVFYDWSETLTEWYVNDRRGLEHGFTVHTRPEGSGLLSFELAVRGGLQAHVSQDGRSASFVNEEGAAVLRYSGLTVFDARGQAFEATLRTLEAACKSSSRKKEHAIR